MPTRGWPAAFVLVHGFSRIREEVAAEDDGAVVNLRARSSTTVRSPMMVWMIFAPLMMQPSVTSAWSIWAPLILEPGR